MSVLQNIVLPTSIVKVRWQEPYITAGLNEKAVAAFPKGVVAGFKVVPSSGYNVEIQADPTLGLSVANIFDSTGSTKFGITVVQPGSLFLDLSPQANSTVYVAIDAQYSVGSASSAQLKVVDVFELTTNPDLIVLCKVAVPASPPVLASQINSAYRTVSGDSMSVEARQPHNLINNGTFERDVVGNAPVGWSNYIPIGGPSLAPTIVTSVFRSGSQSLQLSSGPVVSSGFGCTPISMQEGQTARVGVWIRSAFGTPIVAGGNGVQCYATFLDADYSEIGAAQLEGLFVGGSSAWERRAAVVTAPAGTVYAQLVVAFYNCSGTLYVDDAEFVMRAADSLAQSPVFGGSNSLADVYHQHSAAGQTYAGGPNWADGTTNPPTTIEAQLDKIVSDLAGVSGAPKVGNAPSKILSNVFVNTVPNGISIDAQGGPGNGHGIIGRAGTGGAGSGVIGYGRNTGVGGAFIAEGATTPAFSGQGLVAAGSDTLAGSSTGIFALGGLPNGTGLHGRARGTGTGVYGEGATGSNSVGVQGQGRGLSSGGTFVGGTSGGAPFGGPGVIAQGVGQKEGIYAEGGASGGAGGYFRGGSGGGTGVVGQAQAGNSHGGQFTGKGSGAGVYATGGDAVGTGVIAYGHTSGGYGVYAIAQGGNTPGVFGQGFGSTGGIVGYGDPNGIGTHAVRPNGYGGGGGPGAVTGDTTSHGGDGMDVQGGDAEQLPPPDSTSAPYPRGSAGHGIIGRAGYGRVAGNGVYGFGGRGYDNGIDPYTGPGYGVWGQGASSDSDASNLPYADGGHGVIGVGGDSDFQLFAGHGVRGQNGTDLYPFGRDGACFYATPTTTSAKALLIDNAANRHATVAYKNARPMSCTLSGFQWTPYPYLLQGGAGGYSFWNAITGLNFLATALGVENDASIQFRLPLNAVITNMVFCVGHNGKANFHPSGFGFRCSKRFPNGAALGGTQGGVVNQGLQPSLSAGASVQALTLTLGTLSERTVTAVDQFFTMSIDTLSVTTSASWAIYYVKIDYNMFDTLYLP
jgi:hypothetical protein